MSAAARELSLRIRDLSQRVFTRACDRLNGARAVESRELRRALVAADVATAAGLSVLEAARMLGMQRQRLHERLARFRREPDVVPYRLLAHLALGGLMRDEALADKTGYENKVVSEALSHLKRSGLVRLALTRYPGGTPEPWIRITPEGERELEDWLVGEDGGMQRFGVYYPFDPEEERALTRAAIDAFGDSWFATLRPGTVSNQPLPELAFSVVAEDARDALVQGERRLRELRQAAGLGREHRPASDVSLLDAFHSSFGDG